MAETPSADLAKWIRAGVTYRLREVLNGTGASLFAIGPGLVMRHAHVPLDDAAVIRWLAATDEERSTLAEDALRRFGAESQE